MSAMVTCKGWVKERGCAVYRGRGISYLINAVLKIFSSFHQIYIFERLNTVFFPWNQRIEVKNQHKASYPIIFESVNIYHQRIEIMGKI